MQTSKWVSRLVTFTFGILGRVRPSTIRRRPRSSPSVKTGVRAGFLKKFSG
jgi:hypothetical protein